ncbi:MAG: hypothetical protein OXG08_11720 [Gammaproteobacteria bacterium]|nr:hypothetical protein [Gammaproteobacteria bacterium]
MTKSKYIPGERIREFTDRIAPSEAVDAAYECGLYDGDYAVVHNPRTQLRPELETARTAASIQWRDGLVSLEEIIDWVRRGARHPITKQASYQVALGEEKTIALLLINRGLFKRHW